MHTESSSPKNTALIFGGSRGIGAAVARRLAREGHAVALTYVSRPDKAADVVAVIQAAARMQDGGRIVTIGSNAAVRGGIVGSSVYAMTKSAVATLVRELALDLAPRRITINNVQPGPIETDITADLLDMLVARSPMKRVGRPEEVAVLVAYLAGDEAGYMTGASLTLDGGWVV